MAGTRQKWADKARRTREAPDIGDMICRMIASLTRRATDGDMEALVQLVRVGDVARLCEPGTAEQLRAEPWSYSWADIGNALGITKQAAQQRFGR